MIETANKGKVYEIDVFQRLSRFIILGTDQGSYYASAAELTMQNVKSLSEAIEKDYKRAIDLITEISVSNRAPSNEPALFALALAASHDNVEVRRYALDQLKHVARTGTHLFHFMGYIKNMRGHGNTLRRAIAEWYTSKNPMQLTYQLTKYQSRDGFSHKDLINISHVKSDNPTHQELFRYFTYGDNLVTSDDQVADYLAAIRLAHETEEVGVLTNLIGQYRLPREVLPTWALTKPEVWDAMLPSMGYTALIRNLGSMSRIGFLTPLSDAEKAIMDKIVDAEQIQRGRVHPMDILKAKLTYGSGAGVRGDNHWNVSRNVVSALEDAFYTSFGYVPKSGKRGIIGLDVSSSMTRPNTLAGVQGLSPRVASAVMAMVTVRTEEQSEVVAFSDRLVPFNMTRHSSLEEVLREMARVPFGATDCSKPIQYAIDNNREVDYFITYTDNETGGNPSATLFTYRARTKPDVRNVVVAITANRISLADPNDPYALDLVGLDAATPALIGEFIAGNI